ncbi:MAG: general secretion pathway protein GspK [Acidobacteriia bacterium]|nr:general secretion pathway protein GspK [Terriglobia bacterium]
MKRHLRNSESGVILLIVLWVVVALGVLAFGFATNIQLGMRSIRNTKDGVSGYFLAKGAISESIFEMMKISQPDTPQEVGLAFKQQRTAYQPLSITLETGSAQCWIENESGKLDLNAGSPALFRNLLIRQFDVDDSLANDLVNQWEEWRRPKLDSNGNTQGGPLNSVEELSGLKGMKPEFIYGFWRRAPDGTVEHRRGLLNLATLYSGSAGINLNDAPLEILQALPGVTASEAKAIASARTAHFFESIDDCQQRVPIQFNDESRNLVSIQESTAFAFIASGRAAGSDYERTIRAIVKFGTNDPLGYRIVYWKDEEI